MTEKERAPLRLVVRARLPKKVDDTPQMTQNCAACQDDSDLLASAKAALFRAFMRDPAGFRRAFCRLGQGAD